MMSEIKKMAITEDDIKSGDINQVKHYNFKNKGILDNFYFKWSSFYT